MRALGPLRAGGTAWCHVSYREAASSLLRLHQDTLLNLYIRSLLTAVRWRQQRPCWRRLTRRMRLRGSRSDAADVLHVKQMVPQDPSVGRCARCALLRRGVAPTAAPAPAPVFFFLR